jgi:hypothetical protein
MPPAAMCTRGDAGNPQSEDNVDMNEEQPSMEQPVEAPPAEAQRKDAHPTPPVHDPRRRLRELLAIPERDRSDPVWDEIISLEIETAPGNRAVSPQQDSGGGGRHPEPGRRQEQQGRRPEQQARRQGQGQGQGQDPNSRSKPGARFFKKRKRGPGAPA